MITLLELLKITNTPNFFYKLFSDLEYELDELGWRGDEKTLINDMLFNHFGVTIEDERQLESLVSIILDKDKFKAAIETFKLFKAQ